MSQRSRILVALAILALLCGGVLGIDALGRARASQVGVPPGSIPVYANGRLLGGVTAADLTTTPQTSFRDKEEGKEQSGWPLRTAVLRFVQADQLTPDIHIVVSSTSRSKRAELIWREVDDPANMVLLTSSGRGTLKLVSLLDQLDTRSEWVQDVDRIEINTP